MDPIEFYFLILPLAGLVVLLVAILLYIIRKDKPIKIQELEIISTLMETGALTKENIPEMIQGLIDHGAISKSSYKPIGKILDEALNKTEERIDLTDKNIILSKTVTVSHSLKSI